MDDLCALLLLGLGVSSEVVFFVAGIAISRMASYSSSPKFKNEKSSTAPGYSFCDLPISRTRATPAFVCPVLSKYLVVHRVEVAKQKCTVLRNARKEFRPREGL